MTLQIEKEIGPLGREDRAHEDTRMWAADAVDTSMPLDKPHGVPWRVEIDDVPGMLEIDALRKHIGCHQDIEPILVAAARRLGR
jgi:hypothetical protein